MFTADKRQLKQLYITLALLQTCTHTVNTSGMTPRFDPCVAPESCLSLPFPPLKSRVPQDFRTCVVLLIGARFE